MFSFKAVFPGIYHLHFDRAYDLAMHFVRAQEYYESPVYHKKIFSLVEYMDWYAKEHGGGVFTYPKDWSGFNVPSWVLLEIYRPATVLPDPNEYDEFMRALVAQMCRLEQGRPFYLIGTSAEGYKGDKKEADLLEHELAHAFYTTSQYYRDQMRHHTLGLGQKKYEEAYEILAGMGYHASTIDDEIQAYCATGLCKELKHTLKPRDCKPFKELFTEHLEKCKATAEKSPSP